MDFMNAATHILANSLRVECLMMVLYVFRMKKNRKDRISDRPSHVIINQLVSPSLEISTLTNINEQIEAENDTKRSIARISFELKNLSSLNLDIIFSRNSIYRGLSYC